MSLDDLLRDIIESMQPRHPRYRYFEAPDTRSFLWTTERMSDGKFASAVLVPSGPGARTGKAERWVTRREVHHSTRRAAKARALRLYKQHLKTLEGRTSTR